MALIDDIKAVAKDGADLTAIEGQIGGLNPLDGLKDKDAAFELIKSNPLLLGAHDAAVSRGVESGVDNFKSKGMLDLWKEKEATIRAEVNPKETPEQKEIRELKEWKQESINGQNLSTLKDALSVKAKELQFDSEIARKMAGLGDAVEPLIKEIIAWKDGLLDEVTKGQFATSTPKISVDLNQLSLLTDSELYAAASNNPAQKPAILEEIKRRTIPK